MEHMSEVQANFQTAWDSTSMSALMKCPRYYQYSILMGYRQHREALPLTFGIFYHSVHEFFHKKRAELGDRVAALREAVKYALLLGAEYELEDGTKIPAEEFRKLPARPRARFLPWTTDDSHRNRVTLVQSFLWHTFHFEDDPAETLILRNGKPAVELSFRMQLPFDLPSEESALWCGHLDRVAVIADTIWTTDYKTTKSTIYPEYFDQFSPNVQMSGYTLGTKISFDTPANGVMIDAIQLGVNFARPQRGFAHRTPGQLEEFIHDMKFWMQQAYSYAQQDYWPMNLASCDKYGGCVFRQICSKDKSIRHAYLNTHFEVRHWKPLESR